MSGVQRSWAVSRVAAQGEAVREGGAVLAVRSAAQGTVGVVDARDELSEVDVGVVLVEFSLQPTTVGDDLAFEHDVP